MKVWYGCVVNDSSSALGKEVKPPPAPSFWKKLDDNKYIILHGLKEMLPL